MVVLVVPQHKYSNSKLLVQKLEPTTPGGSVLKLSEKKFEVQCTSVRLKDIQLGQFKSNVSNRHSTRLARREGGSDIGTCWLPADVKTNILMRVPDD